jgi:hypothetical protein
LRASLAIKKECLTVWPDNHDNDDNYDDSDGDNDDNYDDDSDDNDVSFLYMGRLWEPL